jgi:hypothetical protein
MRLSYSQKQLEQDTGTTFLAYNKRRRYAMTDPARYWPGGVPDEVRFHPQPIRGSLKQEIKGWQLFLKVTTTSGRQMRIAP